MTTTSPAGVDSYKEKFPIEELAILISEKKEGCAETKARRFSLLAITRPLFRATKRRRRALVTHTTHTLEPAKPLKSACKSTEGASASHAEAHVTRKVSFSPSTEEESEVKERKARWAEEARTATDYGHVDQRDRHKHLIGGRMRRRASFNDSIGRSGQLHTRARTSSLSWDKHGVHLNSTAKGTHEGSDDTVATDVGRPVKARVSKQAVIAAHHARALEQIINAGASMQFDSLDELKAKREKKTGGKYDRSKVQMIPAVSPRKVLALKKALLDSEKAVEIIAELKKLDCNNGTPQDGAEESLRQVQRGDEAKQKRTIAGTPVRAICLDCTEEEAERRQNQRATAAEAAATDLADTTATPADTYYSYWPFSNRGASQAKESGRGSKTPTSEASSVLPAIPGVLRDVAPISLVTNPAATAAAFGAARTGAFDALATMSSAAVHLANGGADQTDGIYPPLDRMAVFIRWWGFEMTLPEPSMKYLGTARSVSGSFLTFLQTMVVTGGVPELLPFVRYFSSFVDMEFAAIKSQDKGHGVVLAATWLMPMALVPRPWDFPTSPSPTYPAPISLSFSASQQQGELSQVSKPQAHESSEEDVTGRITTSRPHSHPVHVLASLEEVNEARSSTD